MTAQSDRLRDARILAGYPSASAFARANEIKTSTYGSHENGTRALTIEAAKAYAGPLNKTWQFLMFGEGADDVMVGEAPPPKISKSIQSDYRVLPMLTLDEVDITAAGGTGFPPLDERYNEAVVARWQMPALVIRPYTSAPQDRIKIITVIGDSMAPDFLPGERIMVNLDDCIPSPPGVFAIWDGFGEIIKRAEMLPYSDPPVIRLISANREYEPRELPFDQVVINGRVLGKWKWT